MSDNRIYPTSVYNLLDKHFFIPSYQRGYRWTGQQVKDLLKDILDFSKSSPAEYQFYCVQPLVVRKMNEEDKSSNGLGTDEWYEVIDGQQRLVTIYLILCATKDAARMLGLTKKTYEIRFQRDKDKNDDYLSKAIATNGIDDSTIDRFHITSAYKTICDWFGSHDEDGAKGDICRTLLKKPDWDNEDPTKARDKSNNVRFIWYESVDENPIQVFTRLNIGKISLTNSELIKALFLNRSNFREKTTTSYGQNLEEKRIRLRQQEIASEWDRIENTLQDDEFWLFLHAKSYDRPTRIDFIFDLICNKEWEKLTEDDRNVIGTDEYKTFRFFYDRFQTKQYNIESAWRKVQKYFYTFQEWYENLKLYHYVGFLIALGGNITKIVDLWEEISDKRAFLLRLEEKIIDIIDKIGVDRQYKEDGSDKGKCKPILLFHNIQTVIDINKHQINNKKYQLGTFYKFPFHLFKLEGWDVEHINSSTTNPEDDIDTQKEWLFNVYLSVDTNTQDEIVKYYNSDEETFNKGFEKLKEECIKQLNDGPTKEEEWTPAEKNRIWNYTLLDSSTNRSYGNALFSGKRRVIISKEKGFLMPIPRIGRDGNLDIIQPSTEEPEASPFVPPCTKGVFLKNYSSTIGNNNYWSKSMDAKGYKDDIEKCINELQEEIEKLKKITEHE